MNRACAFAAGGRSRGRPIIFKAKILHSIVRLRLSLDGEVNPPCDNLAAMKRETAFIPC
jgi:hypothetical protein